MRNRRNGNRWKEWEGKLKIAISDHVFDPLINSLYIFPPYATLTHSCVHIIQHCCLFYNSNEKVHNIAHMCRICLGEWTWGHLRRKMDRNSVPYWSFYLIYWLDQLFIKTNLPVCKQHIYHTTRPVNSQIQLMLHALGAQAIPHWFSDPSFVVPTPKDAPVNILPVWWCQPFVTLPC